MYCCITYLFQSNLILPGIGYFFKLFYVDKEKMEQSFQLSTVYDLCGHTNYVIKSTLDNNQVNNIDHLPHKLTTKNIVTYLFWILQDQAYTVLYHWFHFFCWVCDDWTVTFNNFCHFFFLLWNSTNLYRLHSISTALPIKPFRSTLVSYVNQFYFWM